MNFRIRSATKDDCPAMLELVRELAAYERAPDDVTVSLQHFEESGFGRNPVWWAYVACIPGQEAAAEAAQRTEENITTGATVQDPLLARLMEDGALQAEGTHATEPEVLNMAATSEEGSFIRLTEPVVPVVPEELSSLMPSPASAAASCNKVIGFALYYIRYSTWKGQRMYLEDIIVTEDWRGKGAGTALMDTLIGEARATGLHGISWQVQDWNKPAIAFYERYGARFDHEWVNAAIDVYQGNPPNL